MRHGVRQESIRLAAFRPEGGKGDMNIYVGNLPYETTDGDLKKAFEEFGEVTRATVIKDRLSERSKGFGFVEMPDDEKGAKAIEEMDGKEMGGRALRVSKAKPRANNVRRD